MPKKTVTPWPVSARVAALEKKSRDAVVRAASNDAVFAADAHTDEMDAQSLSLAHMQQFDDPLRVEDLQLYDVETVHRQTKQPGSREFDESLPASSFEMTLLDGAGSDWVSKDDLLAAGFLDDARRKLKETHSKNNNNKRTSAKRTVEDKKRTAEGFAVGNKKRTAKGIAVGNKKRTSAKHNEEYQKRTPEETDAAKLRLQEKRGDKRERDDKNREKLLVDLRAGIETDAYNWPNALLQEPHLDRECTSSIRGDTEMKSCRKYQSKINNASLQKCARAICWELAFKISWQHLASDDPLTVETLKNLRIYGTVHEKVDFAFGQPFAEYEGLPLLVKAMDADNCTITVCKTWMGHLTDDDPDKRLPPRSTANDLWFGERSELMKGMSIPCGKRRTSSS
jgi:hypothetical protein